MCCGYDMDVINAAGPGGGFMQMTFVAVRVKHQPGAYAAKSHRT
jgi:protein subunit release factor A